MPAFPTHAFTRDNVKVRFLEPTASESINTRHYALPRGVYVGYTPSIQTGSLILRLSPDTRLGFSMLKVGAQSAKVQVDVFTEEDVELDFTGHTVFPVYVIARAEYKTNFPTQGRVLTRAAGPVGPQEITVCRVNKVGTDLVVSTTVPGDRQPPLAFSGQANGYMYGGATDDIVFAQGATAEVIQARDDIKNPGPPPPSQRLADRLALDLAGDFLASQLGLRTVMVVGNSKTVTVGSTSANVSDSFSLITRQLPPIDRNITAGGSEANEGAVTGPTDTVRNVCFLIDDSTGLRVEDGTNHPVFGRLTFATGLLSGTLTFSNALATVTGVGTLFSSELQVGDLIQGADTRLYAVASITNNTTLMLSTAYQGPSASGALSVFSRFTLTFRTRGSGVETGFALAQTTNIRFFFPAWFQANRSVFDGSLYMRRSSEMPVEPLATDLVRGRVKLAVAGGLAGAINRISNNQTPLASSNFDTLNFTAVNASIINAGAGVANINVPGNPGAPGPGSSPGTTGPTGGPGPGGNAFNSWEASSIFGPGGSHSFSVTFASATPPFAGNLVHVVGGHAFFEPFGGFSNRITNISKSGNIGTVNLDLTGLFGVARGKVFLGACV